MPKTQKTLKAIVEVLEWKERYDDLQAKAAQVGITAPMHPVMAFILMTKATGPVN
jgi:hypothetical protein